jgi:glucarate dehydratase
LDGFTKCVVEVETSDGVTGIGQAPSHSSARVIQGFSDRLVGLDPLELAGLERRVLPWMPASHSVTDHALRGAWGGVKIALWGQPVANLLGGIQRREIPFTDYFSYRRRRATRVANARSHRWLTIACPCARNTAPRSSRARSRTPTLARTSA